MCQVKDTTLKTLFKEGDGKSYSAEQDITFERLCVFYKHQRLISCVITLMNFKEIAYISHVFKLLVQFLGYLSLYFSIWKALLHLEGICGLFFLDDFYCMSRGEILSYWQAEILQCLL